ncbi:MAG TPA: S53 family peptidase, partial [bacterium]|nr:S53 family peptidase [bacterium]
MKKGLIFYCFMILSLGTLAPGWAAGLQQLTGHVPDALATAPRVGPLDDSAQMNLVIGLPLRDEAGLKRLLNEIYDPKSPQYHHYLTPDQFNERFGPAEGDYQTLIAFAQSNHLQVVATRPGRRLLEVRGTVADIREALHVNLNHYRRPDGSLFYAPENEPSLDLSLPVFHISGLDNYQLPKPLLHVKGLQTFRGKGKTPSKAAGVLPGVKPNAGSAPGQLYWGTDFRNAYVPGTCLTGTGQSVALLEFESYFDSDILGYESLAGLPNVPVTNVDIAGFNEPVTTDTNGILEVSLDIEMAISMAPGLSQILVYQSSPTASNATADMMLDQMATDDIAKQISCSWTGFGDRNTAAAYTQFAMQGQSFFQAAGDDGAYVTGDPDTTVPSPINRSTAIEMTVVGGTELSTSNSTEGWQSETTWNAPLNTSSGLATFGGGGGVCSKVTIPSYQQSVNMTANGGSTLLRNIPDVSMVADNIFVIADQSYISNSNYSYYTVVGTSAATPLWAGFLSLANEQAVAGGVSVVGFANPAIYNIGLGTGYNNDFHDIQDGSTNNLNGNPALYKAVTGYDLATGWGSPTGQSLINDLTGLPA